MGLGLSADAAERRRHLMGEINGALAELDSAKQRVLDAEQHHEKVIRDARSNLGTAKAEVLKKRSRYQQLLRELDKLLPAVEDTSGDATESAEA